MPEVLRGTLGPIRLASLLQLGENELFSGRLTLDAGVVQLSRGRVTGARTKDATGTLALYELFLETGGAFALDHDPTVGGDALGPLLGLVLEGCRISDEWERIAPLYLLGNTIHDDGPLGSVLARLDGTRTVARAVGTGPRAAVVDPLLALCESGRVREVAPPGGHASGRAPTPAPAPARARGPLDYDTAMDLGRKHLREGRLEDAEQAFQAALAARPEDRVATQNLRRVAQAREGQGRNGLFAWFRRA